MNEAHDLAAELRALAAAVSGPALRAAMTRVGVEAKKDVTEAARRDLGPDAAFSGWRTRGASRRAMALSSGFEQPSDSSLVLTPRPTGPWRVAESGRLRTSAPKARGAKRQRRVATYATPWGPRSFTSENPLRIGPTAGKGTWTAAVRLVEDRSVERGVELIVDEVERMLGG